MNKNKEIGQIKELIGTIDGKGHDIGNSVKKGYIYHQIPFSAFRDVPAHKKNACRIEFEIIKNYILSKSLSTERVLDIGANLGFFSVKMAQRFKSKVSAIEIDRKTAEISNRLIQLYGFSNQISIHHNCISNYLISNSDSYDITLFLNVHMWIFKRLGPKRTATILKQLISMSKSIFFQTAHQESGGNFLVPGLHTKDDIKNYLQEIGFKTVEVIHCFNEGENKNRILYYLSGQD